MQVDQSIYSNVKFIKLDFGTYLSLANYNTGSVKVN